MATHKITAKNWNEGKIFTKLLKKVKPGDTIRFSKGNYQTDKQFTLATSGTPDKPITIEGGTVSAKTGDIKNSVPKAKSKWASVAGEGGDSCHFLTIKQNVSNVIIKNFNISDFNRAVFLCDGASNINISDIYATRLSEIVRNCGKVDSLIVERIYQVGMGKGVCRTENVINSIYRDIYADTFDEAGKRVMNWPIGFYFGGKSSNNLIDNCYVGNAWQPQRYYDNGDFCSIEKDCHNIIIKDSIGYHCADSMVDSKGDYTKIINCEALGIGNRSFRFWGKGNEVIDCISIKEDRFKSRGPSSHIWVGSAGEAKVTNLQHDETMIHEVVKGGKINFVDMGDIPDECCLRIM